MTENPRSKEDWIDLIDNNLVLDEDIDRIVENEKGSTEGFEVPLDKWFKLYRTVREILEKSN